MYTYAVEQKPTRTECSVFFSVTHGSTLHEYREVGRPPGYASRECDCGGAECGKWNPLASWCTGGPGITHRQRQRHGFFAGSDGYPALA